MQYYKRGMHCLIMAKLALLNLLTLLKLYLRNLLFILFLNGFIKGAVKKQQTVSSASPVGSSWFSTILQTPLLHKRDLRFLGVKVEVEGEVLMET